ncbi:MAG: hypothetical protein CVV50_02050, partial [Spirochaetae bacterium HGW-Spirochaetae-6]
MKHCKKTLLFFLLLFFLPSGIWAQEEAQAQEEIPSLIVVNEQLFTPVVRKLRSKKAEDFSFNRISIPEKPLVLQVTQSSLNGLSFFTPEPQKGLSVSVDFPWRAYMLLLEKRAAASNFIPISDSKIQFVDKDKKLKVVVVFKSGGDMDPQADVESYAVVYLNKKKIGVTEQKLLSQPKTLEFETTFERHLLGLEIFVQDPYKKAWQRLRNIEQPPARYFVPQADKGVLYLVVTY